MKNKELKVITIGEPNLEVISKRCVFHTFIRDMYNDMMKFFATPEGKAEFEAWKKAKDEAK